MSSHPLDSSSADPETHLHQRDFPQQMRQEMLDMLILEIREFIAGVILFNQSAADRLGINLTDCQCLNILQMQGAISAGQLAQLTGVTTGAITGAIDRLEKARFVRRVKDPKDRRKVIVEPISDRQAEIDRIYADPGQTTTMLLENYTKPELEIVLDFFTRINDLRKQNRSPSRDA